MPHPKDIIEAIKILILSRIESFRRVELTFLFALGLTASNSKLPTGDY